MISGASLKEAMPWCCPVPSLGTRGRYERLELCPHDDICMKLIRPDTVLSQMRAPVLPWGATGSGKSLCRARCGHPLTGKSWLTGTEPDNIVRSSLKATDGLAQGSLGSNSDHGGGIILPNREGLISIRFHEGLSYEGHNLECTRKQPENTARRL